MLTRNISVALLLFTSVASTQDHGYSVNTNLESTERALLEYQLRHLRDTEASNSSGDPSETPHSQQTSPSKSVRFDENPPTVKIISRISEIIRDPDRELKEKLNKKIKALSMRALKKGIASQRLKEALFLEMDKWDQFVDLLNEFAQDILDNGILPLQEVSSMLSKYGYILNIEKEIPTYYPKLTDRKTKEFLSITIIRELSDFAFYFLDYNSYQISFQNLFEEITNLTPLIKHIHRRISVKNKPYTSANLINEITTLYYLFRFALEVAPENSLNIADILAEIGLWEKKFDEAIQSLSIPEEKFSGFFSGTSDQIRERIFELIQGVNHDQDAYETKTEEDINIENESDITTEEESDTEYKTILPNPKKRIRVQNEDSESLDAEFRHQLAQPS